MKHAMRKILACVAATAIALGTMSCALAAEYPSAGFQLSGVRSRPTKAPVVTEEPVETEAPEAPEATPEAPEATPAPVDPEEIPAATLIPAEPDATDAVEPEETGLPEDPEASETPAAGEPTESPAPSLEPTESPEASLEPTIEPSAEPEAPELPSYSFRRNEDGSLALDENGNPIVTVPEGMGIPVGYARDENGALVLNENGDPIVTDVLATEEPEEETEATEEAEEIVPIAEGVLTVGETDVRLAGDGLSEIVMTLPENTALTVLAIEGDWAKVLIDGQIGYIYKDSVPGLPFETPVLPEDEKPEPKVTIFSSRRSVMVPGETVTLTSKLEDAEGYEIMYQWECDKGDGFEAVDGANGDSYSFTASIETLSYDWQLIVYYR